MAKTNLFVLVGVFLFNVWSASAEVGAGACGRVFSPRFTSNVVKSTEGIIKIEESQSEFGVARELRYTEIKTKDGKEFGEMDLFNDPSDLIIGIDVNGNTQGHMYFVINNERVDGRMFFAGYTKDANWLISRGMVVRYTGLSAGDKLALANLLKAEPTVKGASCVAVACKFLFEMGPLEGISKTHVFPSKFLEVLAQNGIRGTDGKRLTPEIVVINSEARQFWNNLPSWVTVPKFIFKVLFDPYTWQGMGRKRN
ncbi:MAG: hypothetical protein KF789_03360 [Bdellovibrionaceae bacterium]|nr:hypothetical protein [Pseudobdellovibrionaceae bacterium]